MQRGRVAVIIGKIPGAAAEDIVKLHRFAVVRFGGEGNHHVGAGEQLVRAGAFAGEQLFFDAVRDHRHGTGSDVRAVFADIGIQRHRKVDQLLLVGLLKRPFGAVYGGRGQRERALVFRLAGIEQHGVFTRRSQDFLYVRVGQVADAGKAPYAVPVYPCAGACGFG